MNVDQMIAAFEGVPVSEGGRWILYAVLLFCVAGMGLLVWDWNRRRR